MHPQDLRIADYTYDLPAERIAQYPLPERDASKLLVCRAGVIADRLFAGLVDELPSNALLVVNDTRVVKARLRFYRASGALIECMVLEPEAGRPIEQALQDVGRSRWWCMVGNAKRWKEGEVLTAGPGSALLVARVAVSGADQLLEFTWPGGHTFAHVLDQGGAVPLPPYMRREAERADEERYNTVFARAQGSVAAPTASLHFTPKVLEGLARSGVQRTAVTLHVGAGTFLPVKSERMADHAMHGEEVHITRGTLQDLLAAVRAGRPIVTVGTTALRTVESLCWFGEDLTRGLDADRLEVGQWRPYEYPPGPPVIALEAVLRWMDARGLDEVRGRTTLMIAPGYPVRVASGLVTNFHQPGSTLLLLVAAFIGPDWRRVYDHALANGYRFLSYGDGSLLWRATGNGPA